MIKLLAIDMDGTCLDSRSRMRDVTLQALEQAVAAGICIVPTTGRNLNCLPHRLAERKELFQYVISSNGARITDCRDKKDLFTCMIEKEIAIRLLKECEKEKLGFAIHLDHEYYVQGSFLYLMGNAVYGKDARGVSRVKNLIDTIRNGDHAVEEIQFYFFSRNGKSRVRRILKKYPELSAAYSQIYVEIFSKEASKGNALNHLAEKLHISKQEIAYIGDGENDLSAFREAGYRFAMGNGVSELKGKADVVLPKNNEDGVACAIQEYILNGKN